MLYYRDLEESDMELLPEVFILQKLRSDGKIAVKDQYRRATGKKPSLSFLGKGAVKASVAMAKLKYGNAKFVEALEALKDSLDHKENPGLTFEFNRRNLGVSEEGHLILRDCVYDSKITVDILADREDK